MKLKPAVRESLRVYKRNFPQLLLALLVELVIRSICLTPLMFLVNRTLAPLAWLAVPMYLLIALPARQNYALALQDMLEGGSVFSLRLVETRDYFRKLLRGLKGTLCILLWSALTIAGLTTLAMFYTGAGNIDGFTMLRMFSSVGKMVGGDTVDGAMLVIGAVAATGVLILLGCALHSGARHAHALGSRKLLRGQRMKLILLWFLGLLLLLPFLAALAFVMGDWAASLIGQLKSLKLKNIAPNARQLYTLAASAIVLLLPLLPLKNLLPAVFLRQVKESRDAQA